MGNCIGTEFALSQNDEKVSPDEGVEESKASAIVDEKIRSGPCSGWETAPVSQLCRAPLPLAAMLKSREPYRLIPQLIQQHCLQAPLDVAESCNGHRVKIVLTKKQLQLLIRSAEQLKLRHIVLQSKGKRGKKWRPSLATIPEL